MAEKKPEDVPELDDVDEDGKPREAQLDIYTTINDRQYLENALKPQNNLQGGTRNQVRVWVASGCSSATFDTAAFVFAAAAISNDSAYTITPLRSHQIRNLLAVQQFQCHGPRAWCGKTAAPNVTSHHRTRPDD